ncbi:S1C family serine protease [Saliphagus sp. LR7]|uniref:S1C family serine protease n=1 Tax=Saliphagus sp. LR7 TaxID=2282654 RepID=UPI000DF7BCC7|nr:trypsin-like peptidase domain-containing protein [Saliphagus sp. LR7]
MSDPRAGPDLGRRRLLAAVGVASASALAGCSNPLNQAGTNDTDDANETNGSATNGTDAATGTNETDANGTATNGTESNGTATEAGENATDPAADADVYHEVYEAVVGSVTFLQVGGVEDPRTGNQGQGQGSGFLYDDRHVVTNQHVVVNGDEVDVRYTNGDWATTEILGSDRYSDLAVLEVDHVPEDAEPLGLATDSPRVGQEVLAIGNPFGLEGSMSQGIVSGVDRTLEMPGQGFAYPNVVQTDAGINPGNSGGPLVDLEGEVVGVINAAGGDNVGFAISAALTDRVVPALIEEGEYRHPVLGISHVPVDPTIAEENDLPEADGVIVYDVVDGGPADGVLEPSPNQVQRGGSAVPVGGDVVLELAGESTPDGHALARVLALQTSPGETVPVRVYRDGEETTVEVTLGARAEIAEEMGTGSASQSP